MALMMTQIRRYKQYPKEFKDESMALIMEQGYTVANAAKVWGVATHMPTFPDLGLLFVT
jgi:transposase